MSRKNRSQSQFHQVRVTGHALVDEGRPYDRWRRRVYSERQDGSPVTGRCLCECGELSEPLGSDRARQRWHQAHKRSVSSGAGSGGGGGKA